MMRAPWVWWGALLWADCLTPEAGTEFRGNADIQVAILCKSRGISASDDDYWMTVTVRHRPTKWTDRDSAWSDVAAGIARTAEELRKKRQRY